MPIDKNGTPLAVGDFVKMSGRVASIVDADSVTVDSDEVNYPTSTTAKKTVTLNSRVIVRN